MKVIEQSTEDFREIAAALHGTLEVLCFETNDPAGCLSHVQQALAISEKLHAETGDLGKLATTISQMAKAYNRNRMYSKALKYYARARAMRESQEGFSKLALFTCLLGTSNSLWLLGRLDEASACVVEALRDRVEAFGLDDKEGVR